MALHLKSTGIDFADYSDNAGMASELLDDYEEGTWSPTTTAVTNILAISAGYVKVGRTVDLHIRINNNVGDVVSTTTGTYGTVSNVPFAVEDSYVVGPCSIAAGSGHYGYFVGSFNQNGEMFIPWAWSGSSYHAGRLLIGSTYVCNA